MPVYVRNTGAWRQFPTLPQSGRLMYFRTGGQWRPILDMWVRQGGVWNKEPEYTAVLNAPTNLRMSPADPNNHASIPVAWDWVGVLQPDDFHVVLTDEAGNWLVNTSVGPTIRNYTFTGIATSKRYRVYIAARHTGRDDTPWLGPLNWFLGADGYTTNDIPVYGWANEFSWTPNGQITYYSSDVPGFPVANAVDNNYNTQWLTNYMSQPLGDQQGEGIRLHMPTWGHYLVTGVLAYSGFTDATMWIGAYQNGTWSGPYSPYAGPYVPLRHPYVGAVGPSYFLEYRGGNWVSDASGDGQIELLFQNPHNTGDGPKMFITEIMMYLQQWTLLRYDPRTVAPVNSGAW